MNSAFFHIQIISNVVYEGTGEGGSYTQCRNYRHSKVLYADKTLPITPDYDESLREHEQIIEQLDASVYFVHPNHFR